MRLLIKPEHEFYQEVMAGVVNLNQPLYSIPDFIENFWNLKDQKVHRIWLLAFLKDGIKANDDLKNVFYYYAIDAIMHAMVNQTTDTNYYMRYTTGVVTLVSGQSDIG